MIKAAGKTVWYENDQAIQAFLGRFRKPAISEADRQAEERSWVKIMEKSIQI